MSVSTIDNSLGYNPDSLEWTDRYFELRDQIDELQYELIRKEEENGN